MASEISEQLASVRGKLNHIRLAEVLPKRQYVFTLEHNQSVGDALKALAKKKVLSAPLMVAPGLEDLESGESPGPSLLGWTDVRDILRGLVAQLKEKHGQKLPTNMLLLMTELETEGRSFSQQLLITLKGGEDKSLVYQADASGTLLDTIKSLFLAKQSDGRVIHRLAIFDAHGTINNVVSQLDVITYLVQNEQVLGPLLDRSIQELGLLSQLGPVVTVDPHVPTILAYDKMINAGVSAAAVVSEKGEMIANLSVSDLRCIQPEHLGVLALPVAEFLALLHRTTYLGYSQRASKSAAHPFFAGPPKWRLSERDSDSGQLLGQLSGELNSSGGSFGGGSSLGGGSPRSPTFHVGGGGSSPGAVRPGAFNPGVEDEVRIIAATCASTLRDVLQMMSHNHVHRVYILDPANSPTHVLAVVTPTDVLRWLTTD